MAGRGCGWPLSLACLWFSLGTDSSWLHSWLLTVLVGGGRARRVDWRGSALGSCNICTRHMSLSAEPAQRSAIEGRAADFGPLAAMMRPTINCDLSCARAGLLLGPHDSSLDAIDYLPGATAAGMQCQLRGDARPVAGIGSAVLTTRSSSGILRTSSTPNASSTLLLDRRPAGRALESQLETN